MQKCQGEPFDFIILETQESKNLNTILTRQNEKFISFIHKIGLSLEHKEQTREYHNSSTTILTLKTTCFKVDFNDTFVKISPLK